jgi:phytoene dehydrogenase-like protein
MPVVRDFNLAAYGLRTIKPEVQCGMAFSDGRPPIVLHRDDHLDRTLISLCRTCKADGHTYVELKTRSQGLQPVLVRGIYKPPSTSWVAEHLAAVETAYHDVIPISKLMTRSAREVIDDLFQSAEMRACLYQAAAEFGPSIDDPGGGLAFLGVTMWTLGNWQLPIGGMQNLALALRWACEAEGVVVVTNCSVERIAVQSGRAYGVVINGETISARLLVASSAGLWHTLGELVGADQLTPHTLDFLQAFAAVRAPTIASLVYCLSEAPAYRSARWDADIDRCFHTAIGFDGPVDTLDYLRGVEAGCLPAPAGAVRINSMWDPSQAPTGHHVAGVNSLFPAYQTLTPSEWAEVRASYNGALLNRWHEFAPNMNRGTVLADAFLPPESREATILLGEGSDQYRTDVTGLYLCGAATHPGGGIHGGCGYNAFEAIAEDLRLPVSQRTD